MRLRAGHLLLGLFLAGCGGSSDSGPKPLSANPYAAFGYTHRLYRGTFAGRDASGGSLTTPIVISTSEDGQTVQGYGYRLDENASSVNLAKAPGRGVFLASRLTGNLATLNVSRSGSRITLVGRGGDGLEFRAEGALETPDFSVAGPPAPGAYEGQLLGRDGTTGEIDVIAAASGRVEADGRFEFRYDTAFGIGSASAGRDGLARGQVAANGTVADPVLALGGSVVETSEVRAFGTADDLTVAFLYPVVGSPPNSFLETFFRVRRVGP